jgi:hypothetical protein
MEAISSIASGLLKHPDTKGHPALELMIGLRLSGLLATVAEVRAFILGFN